MNRLSLSSLSLQSKVQLAIVSFSLPLLIIVCHLVYTGQNKEIDFTDKELRGTALQRPVEALFQQLPEHARVATRYASGDKASRAELDLLRTKVDQAFDAVAAALEVHGEALEFTPEGLRDRGRENARFDAVREKWRKYSAEADRLDAAAIHERMRQLSADIRTMTSHLGDISNLVLDPDLDSYYVMDVTLMALPQAQDRLANLILLGGQLLAKPALTQEDRIQLAIQAGLVKEADMDRIRNSLLTAFNEDVKFGGLSPTLKRNLEPGLAEYLAASEHLVETLNKVVGSPTPTVSASAFVEAGLKARAASFVLWDRAVEELDVLLRARRDSLAKDRNWDLSVLAACLLTVAVVVTWTVRSYISRPLNVLSETLSSAAEQTFVASEQIGSASQSLAESASEQAASLQETSASLEEFTSMVKRNAEAAQRAKELAGHTRSAADTGATDMREMQQAMNEIRSSGDSVSKILKDIDEIAFQTNILALNAAVEAARAGEAGMGFAVVADEVRNLAQRSAKAARDTAGKIEDAISKTHRGVEISTKVARNFQEIAEKTREVDQYVAEIATASAEQSQGIVHIGTALSQMDKAAQSNAASAEESASAAEELNAQAKSLQDSVLGLQRLVEGRTRPQSDASRSTGLSPMPAAPAEVTTAISRPARNGHAHGLTNGAACPKRPTKTKHTTVVGNGHSDSLPMPSEEEFRNF